MLEDNLPPIREVCRQTGRPRRRSDRERPESLQILDPFGGKDHVQNQDIPHGNRRRPPAACSQCVVETLTKQLRLEVKIHGYSVGEAEDTDQEYTHKMLSLIVIQFSVRLNVRKGRIDREASAASGCGLLRWLA